MGPLELVIVLFVVAVIVTPILLFVRVMQSRSAAKRDAAYDRERRAREFK